MTAVVAETRPVRGAWGDRDPFFDVKQGRRIAAAVTSANFTTFQGAGHFLPEERPQELVELIAKLQSTRSVA